MTDEFSNSAPSRLGIRSKSSGWLGPLRTPDEQKPSTPHDERLAEAQQAVAQTSRETEAAKERVFVTKKALDLAQNGDRASAESAYALARRDWDTARAAEERARVRVSTLGALRADWLRTQALEELGR